MAEKRVGAAAVILNKEGHVLLVKHGYGPLNWELPGGGAEPNESVIETAVRETREETGLIVEAFRLAGVYYLAQNDSIHFVFHCRILAGAKAVADAAEITDCGYWPPDSLPHPISDWTIRRIQDAVTGDPPALPLVIEKVNFVS